MVVAGRSPPWVFPPLLQGARRDLWRGRHPRWPRLWICIENSRIRLFEGLIWWCLRQSCGVRRAAALMPLAVVCCAWRRRLLRQGRRASWRDDVYNLNGRGRSVLCEPARVATYGLAIELSCVSFDLHGGGREVRRGVSTVEL